MTRYLIIGAGAVGGGLGGRLVEAGRDAVLVARGDHLTAMQNRGLRLRTPTMDVTVPVVAVSGPSQLRLAPTDVLVVATKTQQLATVLGDWVDAPVHDGDRVVGTAGERLPLFTATNGVAAETLAHRYFARVFGVCVWMPAARLEPGEVVLRGVPVSGVLHVGRVPAPTTAADDRLLDQLARDWTAAGFGIRRPDDVMPWKHRKLISNLGNVFEALLGTTEGASPLIGAAAAEARAVFDAAGIEYTGDAEEEAARASGFRVEPVAGVVGDLGGSTWQSLIRGTGDIETDYLNGEIAAIAHRCGGTAPVNATLARLGRQAVLAGRRPGDLDLEDLARELGR